MPGVPAQLGFIGLDVILNKAVSLHSPMGRRMLNERRDARKSSVKTAVLMKELSKDAVSGTPDRAYIHSGPQSKTTDRGEGVASSPMTARRTSSTTSLSKYAKGQTGEDEFANRSLEFCNAFWGLADGGFDVLLTRMRGAARTTEELRAFWKERAAIEEDYAKRMSKLAKQVLGRDEIGELRNSIDTLRLETDRQAIAHAGLAQQMRKELEQPVTELLNKQAHFKKVSQAAIEKSFKAKQTQEAYVKKARQKYEDDCVRINSYTAQSTLVQGKDLEKVQLRLEKAKQTVQANEREFNQFARALADTTSRWEKEWKVFCDSCQDLEEERIEFIKDNMWGYANAVSTVCVADDESCEKLRVALEQVEPDKDMENFVRDYNTGSQIPDPPGFVDYNTLEAGQQPSRPSWRTASFARSSNRVLGLPLRQQPPEEEPMTAGNAGVGAGGTRSREGESGTSSRPNSAATAVKPTTSANGTPSFASQNASQGPNNAPLSNEPGPPKPGPASSSSQAGPSQHSAMPQALPGLTKGAQSFRAPQNRDPHSEPIDPRAETMLKVGAHAYPVNLGEDPQGGRAADVGRSAVGNVGAQDDPLARQAAELRSAASGSVRKGSTRAANGPSPARSGAADAFSPFPGAGPPPSAPIASRSSSALPNGQSPAPSRSTPGGSQSSINYHAQAESVVGGPPPATTRSTSPNPPTASFMIPPPERRSKSPAEDVMTTYQQSFPGERRLSISREPSVSRGREGEASSSAPVPRSVSPAREGHVGIGAHGGSRSHSPQPPMAKSPSPAPAPVPPQQTYHAPPPQQGPGMRATTPLGIALDETGNVAHDTLAEQYNQQQEQQRRASYYGVQGPPRQQPHSQPPPQQSYGRFPPTGAPGSGYVQPQPPRQYPQQVPPPPQQPPPQPHQVSGRPHSGQLYNPHAPKNHQQQGSLYNPYTPAQGNSGGQALGGAPGHQQYPSQPPPQPQAPPAQRAYGYSEPSQPPHHGYGGYPQQGPSSNGYQQQYRAEYGATQGYQQSHAHRAPSPAAVHRSPSPAAQPRPPTGQFTDDGEGVLFYVKALYDYQATIDEEFDFQTGDIIAVTATPEDGWWSGMLLDEMRRVPGKTIFPSNFVSLFQ